MKTNYDLKPVIELMDDSINKLKEVKQELSPIPTLQEKEKATGITYGFYWTKYDRYQEEFEPAKYLGNGRWEILGLHGEVGTSEIDEIGERIEFPK